MTQVVKALVLSIELHRVETWMTGKAERKKTGVFGMCVLETRDDAALDGEKNQCLVLENMKPQWTMG